MTTLHANFVVSDVNGGHNNLRWRLGSEAGIMITLSFQW